MRAVVQRVARAAVKVAGREVGRIERGLLVLVAVQVGDDETAAERMAERLRYLRVFEDDAGKMNRDVVQVGGELLVVSQFTLAATLDRGRRPSFSQAAAPDQARRLVDFLVAELRHAEIGVATGEFGAAMAVELVNDGPVTLLLETGPSRPVQ